MTLAHDCDLRLDRLPFTRLHMANPAVRIWVQTALLIAAMMVPSALALLVDERELNGITVWAKPLKFQLSLIVHLLTLAVLTNLVAGTVRDGRLLWITAWASSAMALAEIVYITLQAGRGRASHFNTETTLEVALYNAMGVGAVVLIAAAAVVGWLVLRKPRDGLGEGLRWGCGLGLLLGFVATLVVAGYLGGQSSHWVGDVQSDANGLPVAGWSRTDGDLRVAHFFALHMMQGLPLIGWLADRRGGGGRRVVLVAAPIWLGIVVLTFVQALAGIPLLFGL